MGGVGRSSVVSVLVVCVGCSGVTREPDAAAFCTSWSEVLAANADGLEQLDVPRARDGTDGMRVHAPQDLRDEVDAVVEASTRAFDRIERWQRDGAPRASRRAVLDEAEGHLADGEQLLGRRLRKVLTDCS